MESLFTTGVCLVVHAVLVIGLLHARVPLSPVVLHFAVAFAVNVAQLAILWRMGWTDRLWLATTAFWWGFMVFLFGFSACYKSISLRALALLARTADGTATVDAVDRAVIQPSFTSRVALLVRAGLVSQDRTTFGLTPKGRRLAGRIVRVRQLLGQGRSGLYFSQHD